MWCACALSVLVFFWSNGGRVVVSSSSASSSVSPLDHWKLINVDLVFNGSAPILFVAQKYHLHCVRTYHLQRSSHFAKCFDNNPMVISLKFYPILARARACTANACGHLEPGNIKSIRIYVRREEILLTMTKWLCKRLSSICRQSSDCISPKENGIVRPIAAHKNRFQIIDVNSFRSVFDATHQSYSTICPFLGSSSQTVHFFFSWLVCRTRSVWHGVFSQCPWFPTVNAIEKQHIEKCACEWCHLLLLPVRGVCVRDYSSQVCVTAPSMHHTDTL